MIWEEFADTSNVKTSQEVNQELRSQNNGFTYYIHMYMDMNIANFV